MSPNPQAADQTLPAVQPPPETSSSPAIERRRSRADVLGCLACMLFGLAIAVEPHAVIFAGRGSWNYLADGDDVLYLSIARIPYHGAAGLADPFRASWEDPLPTLYPWLQFVPLAWLARGLGCPPESMGLVWRAVGGPLMGCASFVLFRRLVAGTRHPAAWATGLALVFLADAGVTTGRILVQEAVNARSLLAGSGLSWKFLELDRVVTPLLNLPFLMSLLAAMVPVGRPGVARMVAGAILLGICIHLYFFFWTAAVLGLGAYAAALGLWLVLRRRRGREPGGAGEWWRLGVAVLLGGVALGLPQIVDNQRTFATPRYRPVLERMSRGRTLDADDPGRSQFLRNTWAVGGVALGAVAVVGLGLWRLAPVWAVAAAGFLLLNGARVTGLEFENFHWLYVVYPLSAVVALATVALAVDRWSRPGARWPLALAAVPAALMAFTPFCVWYAVTHAPEPVGYDRTLRGLEPLAPALRSLTPEDVLAGPGAADVALLFGRSGRLFQFNHSAHSSMIPDEEVHERHALNGWLIGLDRGAYGRSAAADPLPVGGSRRPEWQPEAVAAARLAIFDRLEAGGARALLDRYRPTALLLPTPDGEPGRGGPWTRAATGEAWTLWTRREPPADSDSKTDPRAPAPR